MTPPIWYAASQAIICFFCAGLILTLWEIGIPIKGGRIREKRQRDWGMLYVGLAVLVWALTGFWILFIGCPENLPPGLCLARIILSTLNSGLFLLAITYFEHGPIRWKIIQNDRRWHFGVILCSLLVAGIIFITRLPWADVVLSIITLMILGWSLFRSFWDRDFYLTSGFAIGAVLFTFVVQFFDLIDAVDPALIQRWVTDEWRWTLVLTSKTTLLAVLLALGFSWLFEDIERSSILHLEFLGKDETTGKWVVLFRHEKRELTETNHKDLLIFATRRMREQKGKGGWVKIVNTVWLTNLNRISKQLGIQRTLLFENDGRGHYRLLIEAKNIKIHEDKLKNYLELMKLISYNSALL